MNAPAGLPRFLANALDTHYVGYAPLIDRARRTVGARLSVLARELSERRPVGEVLQGLSLAWPMHVGEVLVAPLDAQFDESLLDWQAPGNAVLELPTAALGDAAMQSLVFRAQEAGTRMALRGRPDTPLPPSLLDCFEHTIIHIADDRRRTRSGQPLPPPAGITRRVPFVITGVQTVADLDDCFARGAIASVGWPLEERTAGGERPLQPGVAVLEAVRGLAAERAPVARIAPMLKRDPALVFKLLRLVNSRESSLPVQVTGVAHAVQMLGHARLARWAHLIAPSAGDEANAAPLVHAAAVRGFFLEFLAAAEWPDERRGELYLTGAFSLLDRVTGAPLASLLSLLALPEAVSEALLGRTGPYAGYLALIEALEQADPIAIRQAAEGLALPLSACNEALLRALSATSAPA
jgi:EAL and modified HD-GYP domain-containing signal transduction protein